MTGFQINPFQIVRFLSDIDFLRSVHCSLYKKKVQKVRRENVEKYLFLLLTNINT